MVEAAGRRGNGGWRRCRAVVGREACGVVEWTSYVHLKGTFCNRRWARVVETKDGTLNAMEDGVCSRSEAEAGGSVEAVKAG